ncbi:hypothetical protein NDU88_003036 [Pleurodeles waltl]|uniref:Uncharacterized protein n=1 Tax=Pleurodeles waltl TaxID=8319 RepID=A0AAV7UBL3_PLEWA|nr:hypothetical protein NDU88_003036 [Pleurodeles waltl]
MVPRGRSHRRRCIVDFQPIGLCVERPTQQGASRPRAHQQSAQGDSSYGVRIFSVARASGGGPRPLRALGARRARLQESPKELQESRLSTPPSQSGLWASAGSVPRRVLTTRGERGTYVE